MPKETLSLKMNGVPESASDDDEVLQRSLLSTWRFHVRVDASAEIEYEIGTSFSAFGGMPVCTTAVHTGTTGEEDDTELDVDGGEQESVTPEEQAGASKVVEEIEFIAMEEDPERTKTPSQALVRASTVCFGAKWIVRYSVEHSCCGGQSIVYVHHAHCTSAARPPPTPKTPHTPRTPAPGEKLPPWLSESAWQRILAIRSPLLRLHQGDLTPYSVTVPYFWSSWQFVLEQPILGFFTFSFNNIDCLTRLCWPRGCGTTEIVDFTRYMQPSEGEQAMREAAVDRVREVAMSIWPNGEMAVFGSYATGE
eukprot:423813-Pyramimonas_sp.AAC.1